MPWRHCTGLTLLIAILLSSLAAAQVLEFDRSVSPPELDEFTYCRAIIGELETEIAGLIAQERNADAVKQVALRASITVRILAADLLAAGDEAGPQGSAAIMYGVTLADGRNTIDQSLTELAALARRIDDHRGAVDASLQQQFTESLRLVKRFNDTAVDNAEAVRTAHQAKLNDRLPMILTPLADAIERLDGAKVQSHWIPASSVRLPAGLRNGPRPAQAPPKAGDGAPAAPSIAQLQQRVESIPMRDDLRAELMLILDFLRRGREFPELRPRVHLYQQHIVQVLDLARALANAQPWLDAAAQKSYFDRMRTGILLFKDPRTRQRGQRYIDRLEASRSIIAVSTSTPSCRPCSLPTP